MRKRAWDLGIELRYVHGSGPAGRIPHEDLDAYLQGQGAAGQARGGVAYAERNDEENVPVIGLRRKIAQKMAESKRRIPHFSYVEEIDVTELEELRASLNQKWAPRAASSRCCRCWPAPWWRCAISADQCALRRRGRRGHAPWRGPSASPRKATAG